MMGGAIQPRKRLLPLREKQWVLCNRRRCCSSGQAKEKAAREGDEAPLRSGLRSHALQVPQPEDDAVVAAEAQSLRAPPRFGGGALAQEPRAVALPLLHRRERAREPAQGKGAVRVVASGVAGPVRRHGRPAREEHSGGDNAAVCASSAMNQQAAYGVGGCGGGNASSHECQG